MYIDYCERDGCLNVTRKMDLIEYQDKTLVNHDGILQINAHKAVLLEWLDNELESKTSRLQINREKSEKVSCKKNVNFYIL